MKINYYNPEFDSGIIYSIDMVRLDLKGGLESGQVFFQKLMDNELCFGKGQYYQSFKLWQYRHLYKVDCGNSGIAMGFQLNDDKKKENFQGFVEFNPNKVAMTELYGWLMVQLPLYFTEISVKRWDLAIDIPYKRNLVSLRKDNRKYTLIESQDGKTEYLGTRSHDGFFKCYDKTKESGLDSDVTRLELTVDGLKPFECLNIPFVSVVSPRIADKELVPSDLALVKLISQQDDVEYWLRQVGRRKAEKIKPYLLGIDTAIKVSKKAYERLLEQLEVYQKSNIV